MQVKVFGQNIEVTDAISSHVENRFSSALDRHPQVDEVIVRLEDLNGPKGGVDMRCQATIHLRRGEPIILEGVEADLYAAISAVAARAKEVVSRRVEKSRGR